MAANVVNEKLKWVIDDDYLDRFNKEKKNKGVAESSQAQPSEAGGDSMDFSTMSSMMKAAFNYTWDATASIHRSNEFNFNCMQQVYNFQVNPEESTPFPSRAEFDAYAAWPGDRRPFYSEGDGTAGAGGSRAVGGDYAGGSGHGGDVGDDDEELERMFED